jgi:AcrR family transcriptional regulator
MHPNGVRVKSEFEGAWVVASSSKRREPLTREKLFSTALAIVDEEGLEALSMRRLAREVGVEAASLYHHVPSKDALLEGALEQMRTEVRLPDPMPEDWRDVMEVIWAEYRRMLSAHPNMVPLAGRRVESDPLGAIEWLVSLGLSEGDAVGLWQSMLAYTVGFSMFATSQAALDTYDQPSSIATRLSEWRDETCTTTLRMIIDGYDEMRTSD